MNKPIAVLGLSNWGGIAIMEVNDREETVTYRWYNDEPKTVQYHWDGSGEDDETNEAFFLIGDTKYYFHEFMRI